MNALEQQYKRLVFYLALSRRPRLCRTLQDDWRKAHNTAQRADVIARWVRYIAEGEVIIYREDDCDYFDA